jgi:predicted neutral ceramidase superfamily lipid hydrolase
MVSKGSDKFLSDLNPFSKGLPGTPALFLILLAISVIMGIAAVALVNHNPINANLAYMVVNGSLTGIIAIMLPTLLTIIVVKAFKRYVDTKYIFFISIIGTISYSMFLLLASLVFVFTNAYPIALAIILVGDASTFGWWFFANKVVLGQKKKAILLALVQPTLNILLYLPASRSLLSFSTPFNILLIKLYAGIFIFLLVSYAIIYIVDRPYKKSYGFHSFEAVSQMLQNWLFDANISTPFGLNFGTPTEIQTDTILFKNDKGAIKGIFFIPDIHYGPSGTLGGSDFPFLLERHATSKYKTPAFIMHCTVDMDHNPISSSQFNAVREALDNGVKNARIMTRKKPFSYMESSCNTAKIINLKFGDLSLITLTRAPKVTEDVSLESSLLFKELLQTKLGTSILIDAHNSRYETAPKGELDGVKFNSPAAREYIAAIRALQGAQHRSSKVRVGIASREIYSRLEHPIDIAKGNLNVAVFQFNGFKYAIIQFNANNMLPTFRTAVLDHIRKKYGIEAELYTTDTHAVNSLEHSAQNVLGRYTKYSKLIGLVDQTVEAAALNIEPVSVHHSRTEMKRFKVWGPNAMENILTIAKSVFGITRFLVPIIVVIGFIIAAWLILII